MSENRDSEVERCEYIHIHEDIVEQVNQNMPVCHGQYVKLQFTL